MSSKYIEAQREREPVVKELKTLGFSNAAIARATGVNPITLNKDVARLEEGGCVFPEQNLRKADLYQVVLSRYVHPELIPDEATRQQVIEILAAHIGTDRLHHVAKLNQRWIKNLLTPPYPPSDEPVYRLFTEVIDVPKQIRGRQDALVDQLVAEFISSLDGQSDLPSSIDELELMFVDWCLDARHVREQTALYWADDARQITERILQTTITPREADIVKRHCGLEDGLPRSFEEIGVVYEVTRERIREIHVRAIRKLRHPSRSKLFMELVEPIDRSIEFADRITEVSEVLLGLAMEVDPNRVRPSVVQLSDLNPDLIKPLTELEVYVRTRNVLEKMPITHIYELVQLKEYQVLRMKNAGRKTLNEIKEILADMGLSFGMRFDDQVLSLLKRATRQE